MNIDELSQEQLLEEIKSHGVNVHHKTGVDKLRATLKQIHAGTHGDAMTQVDKKPSDKEVSEGTQDPNTNSDKSTNPAGKKSSGKKLTKEQRAMALKRIVVVPNDPMLASFPGLIFTVGSSAVNNGRMIKKFVPFNNEDGWHVPNIIYDQIVNAEMQKFKSVKAPNGEKVLVPYMAKKFNVEVLKPLTEAELAKLAAAQKARGDA